MKIIETWSDNVDDSLYFKLKIKENEYLDVKRLPDGFSYVLYDAVYKVKTDGDDNLFRECTREENDLALKLTDDYYNKYLKGEDK